MLSRCVSVDRQTFATQFWGRAPLLSRSGALPRDFGDLLSTRDVDELLAERGVRAPFIRMAKDGGLLERDGYLGPAGFGAEIADQVDAAKALNQFASGATMVLQGLHRLWPPLIDFVRSMVDELGQPVQANAYVTPPESRGFDAHYDVHDVFVLQCAGRKHWTVHAPVHSNPLASQPWTDHRAAIASRVRETPVIDTELQPGDALYLPRGWLHAAQSRGELSVHLTIGVPPSTGLDVARAVLDELGRDEELRASLPLGVAPDDTDATAAMAAKLIALLTDRLRDQTDELADGAAARLATRFAQRTRPAAVRPLASFEASRRGDVPVCWRHGLIARLRHEGDRVLLQLTDRTISFPAVCADALAALHRGATLDATTLPGLDDADGHVVVRRLLREAVVVPAERQADPPGNP